jgi:hypothetical protein
MIFETVSPSIQTLLCRILFNFAGFGFCSDEAEHFLDVCASIWENLSAESAVFVLWGIYRIPDYDWRWATQIRNYELHGFFQRAFIASNLKLATPALKCIVRFRQDTEICEVDLSQFNLLLQNGDTGSVSLSLWGVEHLILLNRACAADFAAIGFLDNILSIFDVGTYEMKCDAACCLCTLMEADPLNFIDTIKELEVIEKLLELMSAATESQFMHRILVFFIQFFGQLSSPELLLAGFRKADGYSLFNNLMMNDDEEVAQAATDVMIRFIDDRDD